MSLGSRGPVWTAIAILLVILFVACSLGAQAVLALWAVRQLGSELPIDVNRVAAVAALLFMFYATVELIQSRNR